MNKLRCLQLLRSNIPTGRPDHQIVLNAGGEGNKKYQANVDIHFFVHLKCIVCNTVLASQLSVKSTFIYFCFLKLPFLLSLTAPAVSARVK